MGGKSGAGCGVEGSVGKETKDICNAFSNEVNLREKRVGRVSALAS